LVLAHAQDWETVSQLLTVVGLRMRKEKQTAPAGFFSAVREAERLCLKSVRSQLETIAFYAAWR
jgi:hypothetical protein